MAALGAAEFVQPEIFTRPKAFTGTTTPIFLIHDGGGTTYAYHCLEPLGRFVYGIFNPNFFTGEAFQGGIAEMGQLYAGFIRKEVSRPTFPTRRNMDGSVDIFLGGWSLGGLLSLEVAKLLADDNKIRVKGILMIDSVYIDKILGEDHGYVPFDEEEEGKTKNEILSQRAMREARKMLSTWQIPRWEGQLKAKKPHIVLLRANKHVPVTEGSISFIDAYRHDQHLGWGNFDTDMVDEVIDIEGHHLDLFEQERIRDTSMTLLTTLKKMDRRQKAIDIF